LKGQQGISIINLFFPNEGKGDKCIFDVDKMVNNKKNLIISLQA
jgi:hypothetical protein